MLITSDKEHIIKAAGGQRNVAHRKNKTVEERRG